MTRYAELALSFSEEDATETVQEVVEEDFQGVGNYSPTCNQAGSRQSDVSRALRCAVLVHLGYDVDRTGVDDLLSAGTAVAVDYFYGCLLYTSPSPRD